jgi:tetratricopeptide (TPR) repeat protein
MGCYRAASNLLEESKPDPQSGTGPMLRYFQAWISNRLGDRDAAREASGAAASLPLDYCFPARLEEIPILRAAIQANPADARAPFYLGNLLYDRRRHREAIDYWETAVRLEPGNAIAWRNLGIAYFNVLSDREKALQAYETAFHADPGDGRLFFERDQLWKRTGKAAAARLKELELRMDLVFARDDLSIELCALYNQTGRPAEALAILELRHFQPWEGGEGQALGQYSRACLLLGREALARGNAAEAIRYFGKPLEVPANLGEARHLLANPGDIYFWLGEAQAAADNMVAARKHWMTAATSQGDFQQMSINRFSEKTFYSAVAWRQLGEKEKAGQLAHYLLDYAADLKRSVAKIDYFATSLPTMLLFEDDLQLRQEITARFLEAQATLALGDEARAKESLLSVLESDPSHAEAADLLGAMSMIHRTVREGSFAIR